ncbi:MAG: hypothetical protein R2712_24870 [Vicinamibacterales bacterium]
MSIRATVSALLVLTVLATPLPAAPASAPADALAPGARVYLHAHNCYPDRGQWTDRIARALGTGARHIAIEQDLVWVPPANGRPGRSVVAHDVPARGDEPSLEDHFFAAVAPMMEQALADPHPEAWPLLVLHFDFKTNEPEHHAFVWDLLGRHQQWLTTATRTADGAPPSALTPGPLLVLTESGEGQERDFHDRLPVGGLLRLFGTVPPADIALPASPEGRAEAGVRMTPEQLIPSGATSYRRWTNHSWAVIEAGGAPRAGAWTVADRARLDAVVQRAHALGLWVRFYTLNGYADAGQGWSAGYNFGSADAVAARWEAAIDDGVEFVASDQYEAFAAALGRRPGGAPAGR